MRVHELDEEFNLSKEEVKAALELADLSTHHMSFLDESELQQFKDAAKILASEEEVEASVEESIEEFDAALAGEPSPSEEPEDTEVIIENGEEVFPLEVSEGEGPSILASTDGSFEHCPPEDVFPVCDDAGAFEENCCLDPGLAEKVRAILKPGQRINAYLLKPEQGEFVFIVYETAQEHRVRIDE